MLQTPDGHGRLELMRFHAPPARERRPERAAEHPRHPPHRVRGRRHRRRRRRLASPWHGAPRRGGALRGQLPALLRPRPGGDHRDACGAARLRAPAGRRAVSPASVLVPGQGRSTAGRRGYRARLRPPRHAPRRVLALPRLPAPGRRQVRGRARRVAGGAVVSGAGRPTDCLQDPSTSADLGGLGRRPTTADNGSGTPESSPMSGNPWMLCGHRARGGSPWRWHSPPWTLPVPGRRRTHRRGARHEPQSAGRPSVDGCPSSASDLAADR